MEGKDRGPRVGAWLCPWVGLCRTAPAPVPWEPAEPSRHKLHPVPFPLHRPLPIGVGQAAGQAKHLRLISGENGAWAGPSARALLGGGRDGALLAEKARARSGGWGQHTLPLTEDRFGGLAGSQGEKRATYMSFEPPVKCLTTTGKV